MLTPALNPLENVYSHCNHTDCLQELAGYTGGDVSFLKEDAELQVNKRLLWDSVGHR